VSDATAEYIDTLIRSLERLRLPTSIPWFLRQSADQHEKIGVYWARKGNFVRALQYRSLAGELRERAEKLSRSGE
jgi:hypothetical protein